MAKLGGPGFDYRRYRLHLARERLDLAAVVIFDPQLHPRGVHGHFTEVLEKLGDRGKVRLPGGHTVERRASHNTFVVKGPEGGRGQMTGESASVAAHVALAKLGVAPEPVSHDIRGYHGGHVAEANVDSGRAFYVALEQSGTTIYQRFRGGRLYEIEHRAKNPLILDTAAKAMKAFRDAGIAPLARTHSKAQRPAEGFQYHEAAAFEKWARQQGYDAVIIPPQAWVDQRNNNMSRTWGLPQAILLTRPDRIRDIT